MEESIMSKRIYVTAATLAVSVFILIGIMCMQIPKEVHASYTRYVTASSLTIRKKASSSSAKVGSYSKGTKVTCYGTNGNWTKVKKNGSYAYVYTKYLSKTKSSSSSGTSKGQQIANYAVQFVGNPYKYGGTSLTNGADCSGFTQSVFKKYGYSLPRTSSEQRSAGTKVSWSDKKAGDLICYYGHVAIYIGNNKVVHASSAKTGIKITSPANYRAVASVRRIAK
jgi:cell wall-associated NlpC family hydrolase